MPRPGALMRGARLLLLPQESTLQKLTLSCRHRQTRCNRSSLLLTAFPQHGYVIARRQIKGELLITMEDPLMHDFSHQAVGHK